MHLKDIAAAIAEFQARGFHPLTPVVGLEGFHVDRLVEDRGRIIIKFSFENPDILYYAPPVDGDPAPHEEEPATDVLPA
jgi:hypothetical protein